MNSSMYVLGYVANEPVFFEIVDGGLIARGKSGTEYRPQSIPNFDQLVALFETSLIEGRQEYEKLVTSVEKSLKSALGDAAQYIVVNIPPPPSGVDMKSIDIYTSIDVPEGKLKASLDKLIRSRGGI